MKVRHLLSGVTLFTAVFFQMFGSGNPGRIQPRAVCGQVLSVRLLKSCPNMSKNDLGGLSEDICCRGICPKKLIRNYCSKWANYVKSFKKTNSTMSNENRETGSSLMLLRNIRQLVQSLKTIVSSSVSKKNPNTFIFGNKFELQEEKRNQLVNQTAEVTHSSANRVRGLFIGRSNMIPRDDLIEISPDVFSGNSHKKSLGVGKRRKRRKRGIIIDVSNGVTNNTMVGSNSTVEFANPDWHRR